MKNFILVLALLAIGCEKNIADHNEKLIEKRFEKANFAKTRYTSITEGKKFNAPGTPLLERLRKT